MCCPEAVLSAQVDHPIMFNNHFTKQISVLASYLTKSGLACHPAIVGNQMVQTRNESFRVSVDLDSGEGNGNPLQYSCLENPMDGGAW